MRMVASTWSHLRKPFLSALTDLPHPMAPAEFFLILFVFPFFHLLIRLLFFFFFNLNCLLSCFPWFLFPFSLNAFNIWKQYSGCFSELLLLQNSSYYFLWPNSKVCSVFSSVWTSFLFRLVTVPSFLTCYFCCVLVILFLLGLYLVCFIFLLEVRWSLNLLHSCYNRISYTWLK